MIGLLLKDIFNLGKIIKQVAISLGVFVILAINLRSSTYFVMMAFLMISMLVLNSLSMDEMAKWDKYALTMPIKKSDLVLSKYLLLIILSGASVLLASVSGIILTSIYHYESVKEIIKYCFIALAAVLLLYSILFPLLFKLGVEKGRLMIFIIVGIPSLLATLGSKLLDSFHLSINLPTIKDIMDHIYLVPLVILLLFVLSFKLSVSIYEKKEF